RIIFMSSISGLMVNPFSGPYSSSKFAIEEIAKAFQQELQEFNIEVATINPGPFLPGFNDEEFDRYRTWSEQARSRMFNYKSLAFPSAQLRPNKDIAPIIKVL